GHDARIGALPLQRVLQRERVEERREHPGVVGGRAVHPALWRRREAAVEVPAAHDDGDVDTVAADARYLLRDRLRDVGVDPVLALAHQRLAGELEQDPPEGGNAGPRAGL